MLLFIMGHVFDAWQVELTMIGDCFAASFLGLQCLLGPACPDTLDR